MSESALLGALEACHQTVPPSRPNFSSIAAKHSVNRTTLRRHFERSLQHQHPSKHGSSLLSAAQEKVVLDYLRSLAKRGFYITPHILRNIISSLVDKAPSETWARSFVKRHSDKVKCMIVGGMEASRHTAEYRPAFEAWFNLFESKCTEHNIPPEAIYNMDEKGWQMGVTNKQRKIVPIERIIGSDPPLARIDGNREWVSIVGCICGDGTALTPGVIFKGASGDVGENWLAQLSEDDQYWVAASEKGWTSQEVGLGWLTEIFDPETKHKPNNRVRLLIVDGHNSHVNDKFIEKCNDLRIRLLVLPPHSTHRLQPLDVGFFSPLSTAYTVITDRQYQAFEGRLSINKPLFFCYFLQAWKQAVLDTTIKGAFRKAGLIPLDRNMILSNVGSLQTLPRTPSPVPTDVQPTPSSPLHEGGSQELIRKVRSGKKKAPAALVKMGKRVVILEASQRLMEKQLQGLREGLQRSTKARAFKPIVPGHERGRGVFIGPTEFAAHKRQQAEEMACAEAAQQLRRQKKEEAARRKAQKAREKAERARQRSGPATMAQVPVSDVFGPLDPDTIVAALDAIDLPTHALEG